jgi:predicted HicB family RNase H-like nuclease
VIAAVAELPGCLAHATNEAEAISRLNRALRHWLEAALAAATPIPEPFSTELPSGRWLQRAPKTLHQRLVALAQSDGISLNQLVVSILAEAVSGRGVLEWVASCGVNVTHGRLRDAWEDGAHIGDWQTTPQPHVQPRHRAILAQRLPDHWSYSWGGAHACSYFK